VKIKVPSNLVKMKVPSNLVKMKVPSNLVKRKYQGLCGLKIKIGSKGRNFKNCR
jgi:uncharacterized protein YcnI